MRLQAVQRSKYGTDRSAHFVFQARKAGALESRRSTSSRSWCPHSLQSTRRLSAMGSCTACSMHARHAWKLQQGMQTVVLGGVEGCVAGGLLEVSLGLKR